MAIPANGRLGTPADLAAITNTPIYTCPSGIFTVANISLCNRNSTAVTVRLALASSATPGNAEWLEYGATIPANSVLERTGIVLDPGKQLVAYASTTGVTAIAYGIETSTT